VEGLEGLVDSSPIGTRFKAKVEDVRGGGSVIPTKSERAGTKGNEIARSPSTAGLPSSNWMILLINVE
jgi:hypothetical protein